MGFHGNYAEILFAGKKQRPATAQIVAHHFVGLPAQEVDGRAGSGAKAGLVLAGADDEQRPPQPVAGLDRQVEPLVWGEGRHGQFSKK